MKINVFICYSWHDEHYANDIIKKLDQCEIQYFIDKQDIQTGDYYCEKIIQAIEICSHFIAIISKNSVDSKWINYEIGEASARGKRIIVLIVDSNLNLPSFITRLLHASDIDNIIEQINIDKSQTNNQFAIPVPELFNFCGTEIDWLVLDGNGESQLFEESGMTFDQVGFTSASTQAVSDTANTIIDYINLYHIVHQGRKVDVYHFENPRLQVMTLDDLDMADGGGGGGSEVTIEFNYDGLYIAPAQDIRSKEGNVRDKTDVGLFALGPEVSAGGDSQDGTKIDDQQPATAEGHYTFLGDPIPCETWQQDLSAFEAQRIRVLNTPLSKGGAQGDLSHVTVLPLTKVIKEIRDSGAAGGCAGVAQIRT